MKWIAALTLALCACTVAHEDLAPQIAALEAQVAQLELLRADAPDDVAPALEATLAAMQQQLTALRAAESSGSDFDFSLERLAELGMTGLLTYHGVNWRRNHLRGLRGEPVAVVPKS
ncbi:MAG TPA: hypothetical protein VF653_11440 [Methylomirabilota bacterium]